MHERFIESYPRISHLTERNIADRRLAVVRRQLLQENTVNDIRRGVQQSTENEEDQKKKMLLLFSYLEEASRIENNVSNRSKHI